MLRRVSGSMEVSRQLKARDTGPIYWEGETRCNICSYKGEKKPANCECGDVLYDAKLTYGPWAVLCQHCMTLYGIGTGTGLGQKYLRQKNGAYVKA